MFFGFIEGVKRVENSLLGRRFVPGDKLDIINHEDIAMPVLLPKIPHLIVPNAVNHLVHKLLTANIGYNLVLVMLLDVVTNSVE